MKVQVKDIPVVYNGKSHQPGDTVEIDKKHFDESIFKEEKNKKESK